MKSLAEVARTTSGDVKVKSLQKTHHKEVRHARYIHACSVQSRKNIQEVMVRCGEKKRALEGF